MSQLVPERGRGPNALLSLGPTGVCATHTCTHAPSQVPRVKKRRWSHAVLFPFLAGQSHAPVRGLKEMNYSRKLRQRARQADGG